MGAPDFMTRAERVERFLMDRRMAYEAGDLESLPDHWVDLAESVAIGCSSSELNCDEGVCDDPVDSVKDDVALGVYICTQMKVGDTLFSATVTDADKRDLHFFFIARSEDALIERLIGVFKK